MLAACFRHASRAGVARNIQFPTTDKQIMILNMTLRYINYPVYKDSKLLHHLTVHLVKKFSRDYYYLADQMKRAALSIILNIAEGAGKRSDKDFNRYLENALGSVSELGAAFDVALEEKLITDNDNHTALELIISIKNQLGGLSKKLLVGS